MRKKVFLIGIPIVVFIALVICFSVWYFNPARIFQRKFGFPLPESSKIVNYRFFYFDEEILYMRVSFGAEDYAGLVEKLEGFFQENEKAIDNGNVIDNRRIIYTYLSTVSTWWDVKKNELVLAYSALRFGKKAKTRDVFAYITKDTKEQYWLYIGH